MAPVGMVDMLGEMRSLASFSMFSTPLGIISLTVFLILSITVFTLCGQCHRNTGNTYNVNGETQTDGAGGANGTTGQGATDPETVTYAAWKDHKSMPASTLERSTTSTN
ncbi:hypothetical protein LDENG_00180500 [Lucifuga dentata]|nr:hypothetical protein LDENG_00180500 [Lucifuga dentata]